MFLWTLFESWVILLSFLVAFAVWYLLPNKYFSRFRKENRSELYVISFVKAIKKICPVGTLNKWKLLSSAIGTPRCWKRAYEIRLANDSKLHHQVHGSVGVIKGSSLETMKIISNPASWAEWKPGVTSDAYSSQSFDEPNLQEDYYMRSSKILSKTGSVVFYRFSYLSSDNLGWVLLWNVKKLDWSFFLVQPLYRQELDCCLLTCIFGCCPVMDDNSAVKSLIFTMNSIKDAVEISLTHMVCLPFAMDNRKSHINKLYSKSAAKAGSNQSKLKKNEKNQNKLFKLTCNVNGDKPSASNLKNFSLCTDIPQKEGERKIPIISKGNGRPLQNIGTSNIEAKTKLTNIRGSKTVASRSKSIQNLCSQKTMNDQIAKKNLALSTSLQLTGSRSEDSGESKKRSKTVSMVLEDKSSSNLNDRSSSHVSFGSRKSSSIVVNENLQDKISEQEINSTCSDESNYNSDIYSPLKVYKVASFPDGYEDNVDHAASLDYEILLPSVDNSAHRLADIITNGNYGTSELQAEVFEAFEVSIQTCIEDRPLSSKKWSFHSTYKDVPVFFKVTSSSHFNILSFACRTEVNVKTTDVWQMIKNPNSRFICDETVKKVKVLEQISEDQKIIHTYHEINHLLKKEEIDFCLLHTERKEQSKYYLTIQSVEYVNCPLMDSVTRGMLLPCGWVLQPLKDSSETTSINFLFQILVNNPGSLFIQDLSQFVPLNLYNLKKYLMLQPSC